MEPSPAGVQIAGGIVREQRKLLGDNLATFAKKAGISFQYLSQIERGDRPSVSPEKFARICDALGITDRRQLVRRDAA
jgi:transcriptional regulator with XRE-family HTH domain